MKKIWIKLLSVVMCALMLAPTCSIAAADTKAADASIIKIETDDVHSEVGFIDGGTLVDEYDPTEMDPASGKAKAPSSVPGKTTGWYNEKGLKLVIDLGATHEVTSLYYYNYNTNTTLKFETKLDRLDPWGETVTSTSPDKAQWVEVKINAECRYIHLTGTYINDAPGEIVVYGTRTGEYDVIPEKTEHAYPTISDFMGVNGNIAASTRHMAAVSQVREYHNWLWTENRESWSMGTPSANFADTVVGNFDVFYMACYNLGLNVVPCMMFNSDVEFFENGQSRPSMPLEDGTYDSDNAATYWTYASSMYQYAARYGSNDFITTYSDKNANHEHEWSKLTTLEDNKNMKKATCEVEGCEAYQLQDLSTISVLLGGKRVGLDYIKYIEMGNEPDLTWEDAEDYSGPFQLAALTSAAYDGHEGTMGAAFGVKQADPTMKVAMAGVAGSSLDYILAMEMWAKFNRQDGKLPFDVVNVHSYCTKTINVNGKSVIVGASPEEGGLYKKLDKFVDWRNTYYPDMEVWITEFGWDTNQSYDTKTSSHGYGEYTGRQVQAMWLIRTWVLFAASGADKAYMYMTGGANDDAVGQYGTCGLIDGSGQKKDSWYYTNTLNKVMGDMSFQEIIESGHKNIWVYRFANAEGTSGYVVWCPTSDGTKVENYQLHLSGATNATLVEFANKADTGIQTELTVADNGMVTVNVSECPIIILAD